MTPSSPRRWLSARENLADAPEQQRVGGHQLVELERIPSEP
jgi:hypothetical protein